MMNKNTKKPIRRAEEDDARWIKRYNLVRLMDERGYTKETLAIAYGCTEDYIWQLIRGKVGLGAKAIRKMCKIFKVDSMEFMKMPPEIGGPEVDAIMNQLVEIIKDEDKKRQLEDFLDYLSARPPR